MKSLEEIDTEHSRMVRDTLKPEIAVHTDFMLVHSVVGMCGELGEVSELIKKYVYHGQPLDRDKMVKELGDVMWYFKECLLAQGLTINEVLQTNTEKIRARHPNGFDTKYHKS